MNTKRYDLRLGENLTYCAEIVKKRDYESFLTTQLLPLNKQERLLPILALNAEISIIRQKILRNSGVTGIYQLQFWKDAINTLVGEMRAPIPRQPVVKVLEQLKIVNERNSSLFHDLIDARRETLGDRAFVSVKKLEENSRSVYGTLIRLLALELTNDKSESEELREAANNLGTAVGVATLLRATVPLLNEGVILLPTDLFLLHGLSPDAFFRDKYQEGLKNVTKDLCHVIEHHAKKARDNTKSIDVLCRPAFLPAGLRTDHVVTCLKKSDYNVFSESLQKLPNFVASTLWWRFKRTRF